MFSVFPILYAIGLFPIIYLIRFVFKGLEHKAVLANIPGPKCSKWGGAFCWMNNPEKGWDFFHLITNYGGLAKLSTPFGANDMLYVSDPLALSHIFCRDADYFDDPVEIHLLFQIILGVDSIPANYGARHARQRRHIDSLFRVSRLHLLLPTFYSVAQRLISSMQHLTFGGPHVIDMSRWGNRTSLELIGQGTVGHSFDTLKIGDEPTLLGDDMKKGTTSLFGANTRLMLKYLIPRVMSLATPSWNRWLVTSLPEEPAGLVKKLIYDLESMSKELYETKKSSVSDGTDDMKDIMSCLIQDHVFGPVKNRMSDQEAMSHLRTLIFAANDTTSSGFQRILHVLAHHPKIQRHLREEIRGIHDRVEGEVDYDTLMTLPLLNAVFLETMRLHPPLPYVDRVALTDTVLPLAYPIVGINGSPISEVIVPKGTVLTASLLGVNRHKHVWGPDANEWKPERWLSLGERGKGASKDDRMPGISNHIMTFIDGKRHCPGWRFAQLEIKVIISELIRYFEFSPVKGLDEKICWPMNLSLSPFVGDEMGLPLLVSPA